ncbi:SRPBCC family protein [Bowmanella denitrificans]
MKITIETLVNASLAQVWQAWTTPEHITQWNFAIDTWCCPRAENQLVVGGAFNYRMEAKDGSMGFDFCGTYTVVEPQKLIRFNLGDEREVSVAFLPTEQGIKVTETFEAEDENSAEQQRQGWQGILDNFKAHVEAN